MNKPGLPEPSLHGRHFREEINFSLDPVSHIKFHFMRSLQKMDITPTRTFLNRAGAAPCPTGVAGMSRNQWPEYVGIRTHER